MNTIIFTIADKEYAIDITRVSYVSRIRDFTPVPDAADFVEGVMSLWGKVVPLISLRKKFGIEEEWPKKTGRILIIKVNNHFIGIIVDKVTEVLAIEPNAITLPDDILKDVKYLIGVGKLGNRLILIIDIEKILSGEEKTSIQEVHGRVELRKKTH